MINYLLRMHGKEEHAIFPSLLLSAAMKKVKTWLGRKQKGKKKKIMSSIWTFKLRWI